MYHNCRDYGDTGSFMRKKSISESLFLSEGSLSAQQLQKNIRGAVIGEFVKLIRSHLGMSQRVLAQRAGVPQSMISKIENSSIEPTLSTLRKILDALSCDLVIAPILREPIDVIRRKQAQDVAARQMKYLRGTMRLEKQEPDKKFFDELSRQKENELLHGSGKDLWEK